MKTYLVTVDHKAQQEVHKHRSCAESPIQAAFEVGLYANLGDDPDDPGTLEILAVEEMVEVAKPVWQK